MLHITINPPGCIVNKRTKGNFVLSYMLRLIMYQNQPICVRVLEADTILSTGISKDYGLGVNFAIFPNN